MDEIPGTISEKRAAATLEIPLKRFRELVNAGRWRAVCFQEGRPLFSELEIREWANAARLVQGRRVRYRDMRASEAADHLGLTREGFYKLVERGEVTRAGNARHGRLYDWESIDRAARRRKSASWKRRGGRPPKRGRRTEDPQGY